MARKKMADENIKPSFSAGRTVATDIPSPDARKTSKSKRSITGLRNSHRAGFEEEDGFHLEETRVTDETGRRLSGRQLNKKLAQERDSMLHKTTLEIQTRPSFQTPSASAPRAKAKAVLKKKVPTKKSSQNLKVLAKSRTSAQASSSKSSASGIDAEIRPSSSTFPFFPLSGNALAFSDPKFTESPGIHCTTDSQRNTGTAGITTFLHVILEDVKSRVTHIQCKEKKAEDKACGCLFQHKMVVNLADGERRYFFLDATRWDEKVVNSEKGKEERDTEITFKRLGA